MNIRQWTFVLPVPVTRDDTPTTRVITAVRPERTAPGCFRVYFEGYDVDFDPGDEDHAPLPDGTVDAQTRGAMKRQRRARRQRERATPRGDRSAAPARDE